MTGKATAVIAQNPHDAALECAQVCAGFRYFGLQWVNECYCDNSYNAPGRGQNQAQDDCPGGECPITDCDADGEVDADGTVSLCANGEGNCGNRNAVYRMPYQEPDCQTTSGGTGFAMANQLCRDAGARLSTIDELQNEETRGTGCGYDANEVYSSTPCG